MLWQGFCLVACTDLPDFTRCKHVQGGQLAPNLNHLILYTAAQEERQLRVGALGSLLPVGRRAAGRSWRPKHQAGGDLRHSSNLRIQVTVPTPPSQSEEASEPIFFVLQRGLKGAWPR